MEKPKRVFVSVPRDQNLNESQRVLKYAILDKLRKNGLEPQEFHVSGLPLREPYSFDAVRNIMARCHGVLILAVARCAISSGDETVIIPTVWNHFEGAFAIAFKKEMLVIAEQNVADDGIAWGGGGRIILHAPVAVEAPSIP